MNYLYFYVAGVVLVLFTTALSSIQGDVPDEIESFWDWLFYGIFWPLIVLKHLIKWIIKIFTT